MSSPAAQEASRRNGARSKGPKTRNGRKISARNAFKHGLRARTVLDGAQLPQWLRAVEAELTAMLGTVTFLQRERLDEFVLACLRLQAVDQLIGAAGEQGFAGMDGSAGAAPTPAFMADEVTAQVSLRDLARLHAYRRRFRGRRDNCIRRLFRKGLPRLRGSSSAV